MKTFDSIRDDFLNAYPPPDFSRESVLTTTITKKELLSELQGTIGEISNRTLTYYINKGIIQKPYVGGKGEGRLRESYFNPQTVNKIKVVKFLQKKGIPLEEIKKRIKHFDMLLSLTDNDENGDALEFFTSLARQLVDNIPEEFTADDIVEYFSLVLPDEVKIVTEFMENTVNEVLRRIQAVAEEDRYEFSKAQEAFDTILNYLWTANLRSIFFQLWGNSDTFEDKFADLVLENTPPRIYIFAKYFHQVEATLDAMDEIFLPQ